MEADSRNIHAVAGHQKLLEDQGLWTEAAEERLRLSRLRRSDDSLVLAFLRTEEAHAAARAGKPEAAEHLYRQALALDTRLFPARLGLAAVLASREPLRAVEVLEKAVEVEPQRAYLAFEALLGALPVARRAAPLRAALRTPDPSGLSRLARAARPGPTPAYQRSTR